MENPPPKPEDATDDKTSGKKKKKAQRLGVFAIEPQQAATQPAETAEDIWRALSLTKRRGGRSEVAVPLSELPAADSPSPEANEAAAPLETLSPAEEQFVSQEIVTAQQHAAVEQPAKSQEAKEPEAIARAAIELFRSKITQDGQSPDQAFAETLDSLGDEPEAGAVSKAEPAAEPLAERTMAEDQSVETIDDNGGSGPPIYPRQTVAGSEPGHFARPPAETSAAPKEFVPYYNNEDIVGAAFLGGIIGYLIGRRRGRIKTEKKLKPVQKKLEKQVTKLQEDIQRKEFYIRKAARGQSRDRQKIFQMEQASKKTEHGRPKALEANQLHGKVAPERIGRVLITSKEAPAAKAPEQSEKPRETLSQGKQVETLSRRELLDLSERVNVENTTLRQVYETHLVSEQGLRRLISEYLRGGDVQKALRGELVEHEIDFERDPVLRDHRRASQPSGGAVRDDSPTLSSLLQKAGVSETDHDDKFNAQAKQLYEHETHSPQDNHRRFIDFSLIAIIFILLLLVLVLVMSRQ